MNFRLDINGLRFLAVTMVVLFHFKLNLAYGGFAGVDIFFVISGFLMNEICQKQIGKKGWVLEFYTKRFKRIYPALFVCVVLFFLIAVVIYPPSITSTLYKEVISALTFTSNIFYYFTSSGYFADEVDGYFLLHTWSLSAEWQFYLIFPLVMIVANQIKIKNARVYFYGLAIIASFAICLIVALKSQSASFFMLPTRAWELFLGAFVSAVKFKNKYAKPTELVAILVILIFTFTVKSSDAWPGVLTLIPTLAAAALIHASVDNEKSILRFKPIQSIGSASYSIYLFHWPVVSIFYLYQVEFSLVSALFGVAISLLLGFASYNLIEKRVKPSIPKLVSYSALFMICSFFISSMNVSKYSLPESVIALDKYHDYFETDEGKMQFGNTGRTCFLTSVENNVNLFDEDVCLIKDANKKRLLLIGDSHAAQFYQAVKQNFPDYDVMQATASGCLPFMTAKGEARCTALTNKIYSDYIKKYDIDLVLVSGNWITGAKKMGGVEAVSNEIATANATLSGFAKNVVFLGQTKTFNYPMYRTVQIGKSDSIAKQEITEIKSVNEALSKLLKEKGVNYLDVYDYGCGTDDCSYVDASGTPFMFDKNHMTLPWSIAVIAQARTEINLLLAH